MKTNIEMMAHDYAKILLANPQYSPASIRDISWMLADEMQAEADKRKVSGVPEAILKASNSRELKSEVIEQILHDIDNYFDSSVSNSLRDANNVIQEIYESLSGEKKVDDWQPDWSQAPDGVAVTWAINSSGDASWAVYDSKGLAYSTTAPSFDYKGDWKESLRKRP